MKKINLAIILVFSIMFGQSVFATDISFPDMVSDNIDESITVFEELCNDSAGEETYIEFTENNSVEEDNSADDQLTEDNASDEVMWSDEELDIVINDNTMEVSDQIVSDNETSDSPTDHLEEDEFIYEEINQTDELAYAANDQFKVTFVINDGSPNCEEEIVTWQVTKGTTLDSWPGVKDQERRVFIGWSTSRKRSDLLPFNRDGYLTVTKDITLYSIWTDACLITYNANGGTFYDGGSKITTKYEKGKAVSRSPGLDDPKGKRFEGWSTTRDRSGLLPFGEGGVFITPKKDMTLYAIWQDCCEITYDANGWIFSDGSTTRVYKEDKGIYLNGWPAPKKREGWTYLGVNTDPKAKTALEFDQSTGGYYHVTKDVTLYFIWVKICKITYDANGGTIGNGESKVTYDENKGEVISSWYPNAERAGYYLVGWSREKGGSPIQYNKKIKGYFKVNGDTTLYAVWKKATLSVRPTSLTMKKGTTKTLTVKSEPSGKITYKSSDKKIAAVNSSGKITAKKKGRCTIEVSCNGLKKTVKVVVK